MRPRFAAIIRTIEAVPGNLCFNKSVDGIRFRGCDSHGDAAPGFGRQALGALFIQLGPGSTAVSALEKTAAAESCWSFAT